MTSAKDDSAVGHEEVAFLKSTSRTGALLALLFALLGFKGHIPDVWSAGVAGFTLGIAVVAYAWYRIESKELRVVSP